MQTKTQNISKTLKIVRKPPRTASATPTNKNKPQLLRRFKQMEYEYIDWKAVLK